MSRKEPRKVSLGSHRYPAVQSHLSALIDDRGLAVEGKISAPGVTSVWGYSDYEYWVKVEPDRGALV